MISETISHYRILSILGAGGMGEVYLAEDLRLGRRVALKILPPIYTQDADRVRRFEQEARTASALCHPNILTIYEIGCEAEVHFIATELVEGVTLRRRITGQRLSMEEAVGIAAQLADALAAAHAAGVTHRDIKPENIMLRDDGYVKVLDFGLAKLTEKRLFAGDDPNATQAETVDDLYATLPQGMAQETSPGMILGTISYMSPEQVRGLKTDSRTDLFSLGIVLYEIVTGRPPFQGATTGDIMVSLLDRQPPPLARFAPDTPEELEWIVDKALSKDREGRYQSAKALLADLRRLQKRMQFAPETIGHSSGDMGFVSDGDEARETTPLPSNSGGSSPSGRSERTAIDSLAVLPFYCSAGSEDAAYLCEGIPESLIVNLSRLAQLRVMAWSTVARYRGRDVDVLAVGRELGVRTVFAGRLIQRGDRLVIKTELISTDDGSQLWGEQYQRQMDDLLTIEQEISSEICERLRLRLNEEERRRLVKRYTQNADAYHLYLKGRFHWNQRSAKGLRKAIECFEAAIRLDEQYALAYAGLADCYCLVGIYGGAPPKAVMPRAKESAMKALAIDDGLAEAHTGLAASLVWYEWDWAASEREFKRAIELNPAYSVAHHWYGSVLLSALGRHDEAMAEEKRALKIEPLSLVINSNLGFICYQAGRFEEAVEYQQKAIEMDEGFVYAHFNLGLSLAQLARFDEAVVSLRRAIELAGGRGALITAALGYVYALSGRRDEALEILSQLQTYPANRDVSPFFLAMIHTGFGDKDRAIAALEAACEERYNWVVWLRTEPMLAPLRRDARFQALLQRIGLAA